MNGLLLSDPSSGNAYSFAPTQEGMMQFAAMHDKLRADNQKTNDMNSGSVTRYESFIFRREPDPDAYYKSLLRLFEEGGLFDQLAVARRHYENLLSKKQVFSEEELGMKSSTYFSKHFLGGDSPKACDPERYYKRLRYFAACVKETEDPQGLYGECLKILKTAEKSAGFNDYPIISAIVKYTFCKEGRKKHYNDAANRRSIRKKLELVKGSGLVYSLRDLENISIKELKAAIATKPEKSITERFFWQ